MLAAAAFAAPVVVGWGGGTSLPVSPAVALRGHRLTMVEVEVEDGQAPMFRSSISRQQPKGAALSEDAVSRVFELVWRDTRGLFRTALQRPLPVVIDALSDRVPIATWFLTYRADQLQFQATEALLGCDHLIKIAPQVQYDLRRNHERLDRRIVEARTTLWPTLRTLLFHERTQQRVLEAARAQMQRHKQEQLRELGSSPARGLGDCALPHPPTHQPTHPRTHAHTHTHARTHTHAHARTRTHARTHARTRTRTRTHARTHAHAHAHARTRTRTRTHNPPSLPAPSAALSAPVLSSPHLPPPPPLRPLRPSCRWQGCGSASGCGLS